MKMCLDGVIPPVLLKFVTGNRDSFKVRLLAGLWWGLRSYPLARLH